MKYICTSDLSSRVIPVLLEKLRSFLLGLASIRPQSARGRLSFLRPSRGAATSLSPQSLKHTNLVPRAYLLSPIFYGKSPEDEVANIPYQQEK